MKIETVGSYLPDELLIQARNDFQRGLIDRQILTNMEDRAVLDLVERQIEYGVEFITSGELRRKHWANDFWFGLNGISCEHVEAGHVYQPIETATDLIRITGRITFNPRHPFFDDFRFLHRTVAGRAKCRQSLPSPANLLLEIYALSDGKPETVYPSAHSLISDIADAYRLTALELHSMGCDSLQYDDTALGLMCDDNYTKRLLQGGVDLIGLHRQLIDVINLSLKEMPLTLETSIYISGGDKIVPEWEYIEYPDNVMPKALSSLNVDKFFLPFDIDNEYAIKVLRHVPEGKTVVLGLADAHSPFPENSILLSEMAEKVSRIIHSSHIALSTRTGFKMSNYSAHALTYEDQWRKISDLASL